jgi:primosomal protein N' (replication factor Y)
VVDEEHDTPSSRRRLHLPGAGPGRRPRKAGGARSSSPPPRLPSRPCATPKRTLSMVPAGGRHGDARLPDIRLVDLRQSPPDPGQVDLAALAEAMAEPWRPGSRPCCFLNRRGYAPLVLVPGPAARS